MLLSWEQSTRPVHVSCHNNVKQVVGAAIVSRETEDRTITSHQCNLDQPRQSASRTLSIGSKLLSNMVSVKDSLSLVIHQEEFSV